MPDDIEFYTTPGPMTGLDGVDERLLAGVPTDPAGVARIVQGLVIHPFLTTLYGLEPPADRGDDVQVRSAAAMVATIVDRDDRPLDEARVPADRLFGNCRNFSVLTTALLRRAGVPARARCGFGGYFEAGKWVDHWIVEHWDGDRWVVLDPQIDAIQREAMHITADPADLPPGWFLPAGEAWRRCRTGEEDGDRFGILDMWGQWFILGNINRDLAALNKVEMLPWDGWGALGLPGDGPSDAWTDAVAALCESGDIGAIRDRYDHDDDLRVPSRVHVFVTADGPMDLDIPELIAPA